MGSETIVVMVILTTLFNHLHTGCVSFRKTQKALFSLLIYSSGWGLQDGIVLQYVVNNLSDQMGASKRRVFVTQIVQPQQPF